MPRTSQFVPKGSTPNTPTHYPVVDQPNTPSMESNAMALAEKAGNAPGNAPVDPHGTPALLRTEHEINAGKEAIARHQESLNAARERSQQENAPAEEQNRDRLLGVDELEDGTPFVRDVTTDMTPVTLEDGSQARVPKRVADEARARTHARSADMGTGKMARGVDPRDPKVRQEEYSPDLDRNTPKGPATMGVAEGEQVGPTGTEPNPDNARLP
jgi:hypothetical protein